MISDENLWLLVLPFHLAFIFVILCLYCNGCYFFWLCLSLSLGCAKSLPLVWLCFGFAQDSKLVSQNLLMSNQRLNWLYLCQMVPKFWLISVLFLVPLSHSMYYNLQVQPWSSSAPCIYNNNNNSCTKIFQFFNMENALQISVYFSY